MENQGALVPLSLRSFTVCSLFLIILATAASAQTPSFWAGSYTVSTCNTPGYVGSGDPCSYIVWSLAFGDAGFGSNTAGLYVGPNQANNVRYEQQFDGEFCSAGSGVDLSSASSWVDTEDLSNVFLSGAQSTTLTFTVTQRTAMLISGTFAGSFEYPSSSGTAQGQITGQWSLTPLSAAFPKCITNGYEWCYAGGIAVNALSGTGGTGSCPFLDPTSPAPSGEWSTCANGCETVINLNGQQFVSTGQATIAPRVCTTTRHAVTKQQALNVTCRDKVTLADVPCDNISVTLQETIDSGGHQHDNGLRPIGSLSQTAPSCSSGTNDAYGSYDEQTEVHNLSNISPQSLMYFAPEVGGQVVMTANANVGGQAANPTTVNLQIQYPTKSNLQPLTNDKLYYVFTGAIAGRHTDNHWGQSVFDNIMDTLAFVWWSQPEAGTPPVPIPPLAINDMSLFQGGIFDIDADWVPPHSAHRWGTEADIGSGSSPRYPSCSSIACWLPKQYRAKLRQYIRNLHLIYFMEGNHYHVRYW